MASEHQIDLTQVKGTGFEGRVTKKDVEHVISNPDLMLEQSNVQDSTAALESAATPVNAPSNTVSDDLAGESIPVNGVRKAIAKHMVESVTEIPHAWMMVEADATLSLIHI